MPGCGGRAPSGAARGGQDSVRLPYSPRVPPACAVGARPPPRYPRRRPTALAADTAGAAPNLGVVLHPATCRRAPRSIAPASGAAEAGRWAVPRPQRGPAMRVARRQRRDVGAGLRRRNVGRVVKRCVGRAPSVAWGAAGRNRYACRYRRAHARMGGGRPPAAPLPNQPPNHARSRHRWRGRQPGRFLGRRRVPSRASLYRSCQRRC